VKEARCGLGEGINLTPTWLIGKLESILARPSTFNLTLADGSNQKSRWSGYINDTNTLCDHNSSIHVYTTMIFISKFSNIQF